MSVCSSVMIEGLAVSVMVAVGQGRGIEMVFTPKTKGVKMFPSHWGKSLLVSDLCSLHNALVCSIDCVEQALWLVLRGVS